MKIANATAKKIKHLTGVDPNQGEVSACQRDNEACIQYAALCLVADVLRSNYTLNAERDLIGWLKSFQRIVDDFLSIPNKDDLRMNEIQMSNIATDLLGSIGNIKWYFSWDRNASDRADGNKSWIRMRDFIHHRRRMDLLGLAEGIARDIEIAESILSVRGQMNTEEEERTTQYAGRVISSQQLKAALMQLRKNTDTLVTLLQTVISQRIIDSERVIRKSFANCAEKEIRSKFSLSHDNMAHRLGGTLPKIWRPDMEEDLAQ